MAELYAFAGRRRIGIFRHAGPRIAFAYDDSAGPTPISLSLPRSGQPVTPAAARAWLDNLLPAREDVRRRWARERGLPDTEPMTLLASYGDDLAGAISLSPDPDLPWRRAPQPVEAPLHEIATRLAALRNQPTSWLDQRARPRFSLGGHHGKFALRRASGKWLWPTYEHPSTHILRPTTPEEGAARIADLDHARSRGIPATRTELVTFGGQSALVAERWDRLGGQRIHAETIRQALGLRPADDIDPGRVRDLFLRLGLGSTVEHHDLPGRALLLAGDRCVLAPLSRAPRRGAGVE
ncbi:HipA-like protein [Nocardioides albertanoniae]|uniref:HipA-like protein n=1 Tax=Nocardioides albertanoniae TaxID=1175486 RepID=A0A543A323_9ACTN|nr:HipA N-terminal domain-containing protein [Nocardioides albertanoniae]TQL66964.1 HipA-like protein [Nocardioides albertanoniae]